MENREEMLVIVLARYQQTNDHHRFSAACRLLGSVLPRQNGTKHLVLW